jgi:hypothetical protein
MSQKRNFKLVASTSPGFWNDRRNLVYVACDGAAVMLGNHSGVTKFMKERFSSVIVWHCVKHRSELSVSDAVHAVSGIDRFRSFIDKLYVPYHASQKEKELHACATLLEQKLLALGRILSII